MTGARHPPPPRRLVLGAVLVALVLTLAACGSSGSATPSPSTSATTGTTTTVSNTKAKFVLHAGLAFGAFYHWIYKPFKAGELGHPLSHKLTTLKAALAGVFIYHELKLALADAQADPTLSHLVAPITALQDKIKAVASDLKSGNVDTSQIAAASGSIGSIQSQAAAAGHAIAQLVPSTPAG